MLYLRGDDKTKVKSIAKSKNWNNKKLKGVTIKTKQGRTKFKLRCPRYLYTLKIDDSGKAEKIKSSIPSGNKCFNFPIAIKKIEINDKSKKEEKKQQTGGKKSAAKK